MTAIRVPYSDEDRYTHAEILAAHEDRLRQLVALPARLRREPHYAKSVAVTRKEIVRLRAKIAGEKAKANKAISAAWGKRRRSA